MAIDTRTSRAGLDRNKYYKAKYVENMKLTKDAESVGVFYSTDEEPIHKTIVQNGSTRHKQTIVKVRTYDYVPDLELDDYVLYAGDDQLYVVFSIRPADIDDNTKMFKRHATSYIIELRR